APGRDIWSTWTDEGYAYQEPGRDPASASAFVAGVAALVRSYAPQLSASEVTQVLIDSAYDLGDPGPDVYFGAGRVDAKRALELAPAPAVRFEHVEPFPSMIPPGRASSFVVRIASVAETVLPNAALMFHRNDSAGFASKPLIPLESELFLVELPAVQCEATLQYYLVVEGDGGSAVNDPLDAPAPLYSAYAIHTEPLFDDDFESDLGWEVEGGDNRSGRWSRVIPVGTSAQPGFDYSPDARRYCYITGQHVSDTDDGYNDVDGGPVILTSPIVELPPSDAEVSYARWFHSTIGTPDQLTVELSRDGGGLWTTVETVESTDGWVLHNFRLSEFPGVTGDQLRVRFSTSDIPNDSLTEAAIDEFHVRAIRCSVTPGDADDDSFIDLADFERMMGCWTGPVMPVLNSSCWALDFDGNRRVDLSDYQSFQNAFSPSVVQQ
ncbi:MAG: S8 family serine peptidase, partial [Phycisphaerae bacterium]